MSTLKTTRLNKQKNNIERKKQPCVIPFNIHITSYSVFSHYVQLFDENKNIKENTMYYSKVTRICLYTKYLYLLSII